MSVRLFSFHIRLPMILLVVIEGALFVFAPFLAAGVRQVLPHDLPANGILPTALLFSTYCLFSLFAVGLYTTRQRSGKTSPRPAAPPPRRSRC